MAVPVPAFDIIRIDPSIMPGISKCHLFQSISKILKSLLQIMLIILLLLYILIIKTLIPLFTTPI